MLGKVFKAYDIRATYPKPLNEKLAWQIGYGCAQYLIEQAEKTGHDDPMMRHIVVGRDMRASSPKLAEALKRGIRDYGAHVIDVGMVDTPFIYFAINHLGCAGGVQTTASHNPANYNGFKISGIKAKPVGMSTGLDEIRKYSAMADREKLTAKPGREEKRDLWDAYRNHVRQFLTPKLLKPGRSIKVSIDASNGMAGTMIPKVFNDIAGLKITKLNFDNSSGEFVHEPNPLVESNLDQLRESVRTTKADLGICFDGDADRLVVVDEKADIIGCDHLTAWLAQIFLKESPGSAIVYDLRSTKALAEIIRAARGKPVKSRVGHVFMKQAMAKYDAVFGGELSGHFYFRKNFYADSGAIAFAAVISGLANATQPLSKLIAPARKYSQSGEINFETDDKEAAIDDLKRAFPEAKIDELDGVTVDLGDWWLNVRPSNTEPLLRLNLEGPDRATVDDLVREVSRYLGRRVAH
ncbi:MAG: phosphomannomutase/phosphoglucomutase [Phycisphaerales bacterium]|nr:phosphomannomutase/phosphoglucomutase [Phycisphaerales bacterium]MCI0675566.1 phosphomannomutase/phosphoglucomutase [Phycisphaerales bacterium]